MRLDPSCIMKPPMCGSTARIACRFGEMCDSHTRALTSLCDRCPQLKNAETRPWILKGNEGSTMDKREDVRKLFLSAGHEFLLVLPAFHDVRHLADVTMTALGLHPFPHSFHRCTYPLSPFHFSLPFALSLPFTVCLLQWICYLKFQAIEVCGHSRE